MAIFLPFFTHYCLTIMLDEAIVIRHDNGKHYLGNASLKKKNIITILHTSWSTTLMKR